MQKSSQLRELGNGKAKVTIDRMKRLITVSGDQQNVLECERNVKDFLRIGVTATKISRDTPDICTMCMCEFDSPYSLQECGHIFCRSCLISYFESDMDSTMTTDTFKICCPFNRCGVACLIRDIVSILGSEKTSNLAKAAFERYIRNSENDLVQCSGNNCIQVYRPSKHASTYYCDQCIKIYCVPCNVEYHTGMTCKQFQDAEKERKNKKKNSLY
jgi:ATP-dependent RNA helicase DHX8/PRP22